MVDLHRPAIVGANEWKAMRASFDEDCRASQRRMQSTSLIASLTESERPAFNDWLRESDGHALEQAEKIRYKSRVRSCESRDEHPQDRTTLSVLRLQKLQ